jgi:hypothetical protein
MHTIALEEYSNGQGALINGRVDGHFLEDSPPRTSCCLRDAPVPQTPSVQPATFTVSPATV